MTTAVTNFTCRFCGQAIQQEDLNNGLAVRVDGKLTCPMCVDHLPSEAQLRINQLRALRGLNATTFRVPRAKHPELHSYTFTTSINFARHRRELRTTGVFTAPDLPLRNSSDPTPLAAAIVPPVSTTATTTILPAPAKRYHKRIAFGTAAAVVICVILLSLRESQPTPPVVEQPAPSAMPMAPTQEPSRPEATRTDYDVDPAKAWEQASADQNCPPKLLRAIADDHGMDISKQLDAAERAITAKKFDEAETQLASVSVPEHLYFRTQRGMQATLRDKLIAARREHVSPPVKEPPPQPVVIKQPEPAPKPAVMKAPEPTPIPAVQPSTDECILILASDLLAPEDKDIWHEVANGIKLDRSAGSLRRPISLQGGEYQAWLKVRGENAQDFVQVGVSERLFDRVDLGPSRQGSWIRLTPDKVSLIAGTHDFKVVVSGKDVSVYALYLAGVQAEEPEAAIAAGKTMAPTWALKPDPAPTPQPRIDVVVAKPMGGGVPVNPISDRSRVPAGFPGNCPQPLESSAGKNRKTQAIILDLTGYDASRGGIALTAHPVRGDRQKLNVAVIDAQNRRFTFHPLAFPVNEWTTFTLSLAAADPAGFSASSLKSLVIEDATPLTTSFMLAKAVVATNAEPTAEMLDVRPQALVPLNYKDLENVLSLVAAKRKSRNWRRDFKPELIKILAGQQMMLGEWDTLVRKGLQDLLKLKTLPPKTLQQLVLNNDWLNGMFDAPDVVIDPAKHHIVVICTAGNEFPIGLTEPQAFINFWKAVIDLFLERGLLPVVVLGPDKVNADDKVNSMQLWQDLSEYMAKSRNGVPVIDLRPARALDFRKMAPGMTQLGAQLILDGYAELLERIRFLRDQPPKT